MTDYQRHNTTLTPDTPAGPTIYGASANIHELESRILAKQEQDNGGQS